MRIVSSCLAQVNTSQCCGSYDEQPEEDQGTILLVFTYRIGKVQVVVRDRKWKEINIYFRLSELQFSLATWAIRTRELHVIDLLFPFQKK